MAYQFVSPGATAFGALEQYLAQAQQQRRQQLIDEATQREREQRMLFAQQHADRQAKADARTAADRLASLLQPGASISEDQAAALEAGDYGPAIERGLPATVQNVEQQSGPIGTSFRGTPEQLAALQKEQDAQRTAQTRADQSTQDRLTLDDPNATWSDRIQAAARLGLKSSDLTQPETPEQKQSRELSEYEAKKRLDRKYAPAEKGTVQILTGPDGNDHPFVWKDGKFTPIDVPAGYTIKAKDGKATDSQNVTAGFAERMSQASPIIAKYEDQATSLSQVGGSLIPNVFKSSDRQNYESAKRNWISANLRKESGAAISESEYANADQEYFPQPGDAPQVVEAKRQRRQIAETAMRRAAGPALSSSHSSSGVRRVVRGPDGTLRYE